MSAKRLNRAIKYRAYPTDKQAELFAKTFGCVRLIWNNMLADAQRFSMKRVCFLSLRRQSIKKSFRFLKKLTALPWPIASLT